MKSDESHHDILIEGNTMQVSTYNVFEYIIDNPAHNITFIDSNNTVVRLEADQEKESLYIHMMQPHDLYVDGDQVTISLERSGKAYKIETSIQPAEYELIRTHALNKLVQIELKRLLPAVNDMLNHYDRITGANKGIDLYVLRDLAYTQPSKGVVVLQVKAVSSQDQHRLCGYVSPFDKDAIYYESVQSWRYAQVVADGPHSSEFSRAVYEQLPDDIKAAINL